MSAPLRAVTRAHERLRGALARALPSAPALAVGATIAYAGKRYYAGASAEGLRFVLAPTTVLVEALTGIAFEWEAGAGYLSRERAYLIAPACAGLNFSIAALAALLLGFTARLRTAGGRAAWLAASCALALVTTPLANAARIALDLALRRIELPAWCSRAELHRIEGVAIYFGVLLALHAAVSRALGASQTGSRALRAPLFAYCAVALGVPWLGGASAHPEFLHHAAIVLACAVTLAGAWWTAARYATRSRA